MIYIIVDHYNLVRVLFTNNSLAEHTMNENFFILHSAATASCSIQYAPLILHSTRPLFANKALTIVLFLFNLVKNLVKMSKKLIYNFSNNSFFRVILDYLINT